MVLQSIRNCYCQHPTQLSLLKLEPTRVAPEKDLLCPIEANLQLVAVRNLHVQVQELPHNLCQPPCQDDVLPNQRDHPLQHGGQQALEHTNLGCRLFLSDVRHGPLVEVLEPGLCLIVEPRREEAPLLAGHLRCGREISHGGVHVQQQLPELLGIDLPRPVGVELVEVLVDLGRKDGGLRVRVDDAVAKEKG